MFPEFKMNWGRTPFTPGSKMKPRAIVGGAAFNVALRRLIACWTFCRVSALLTVLLICIVSTVSVSAEDHDDHAALPPGSCLAAGSQSVLIAGRNVVSYVPKGSWVQQTPDIAVVSVEPFPLGTSTPKQTTIKTNGVIMNSCASNSSTGDTVCTSNDRDVWVISGTNIKKKLMSDGLSSAPFTGGFCTNCGVTMDTIHNRAVIGLSLDPMHAGYQIL